MSPRPAEGCPGTEPAASGIRPARRLAHAFLPASRRADIAVQAPDVIRRHPAALPSSRPAEIRGAGAVVKEASCSAGEPP
jgi:hypothetical protein